MKKWQKISFFTFIVVLILGVSLYMIFIFEMFPVHRALLLTVAIPDRNYEISAYYVDSGATSRGVLQLQKVYASGESEVIKNVPGHIDMYVKAMEILPEGKLRVVVGSKGQFTTEQDTVFVEIE
jgi:hypothetical protein